MTILVSHPKAKCLCFVFDAQPWTKNCLHNKAFIFTGRISNHSILGIAQIEPLEYLRSYILSVFQTHLSCLFWTWKFYYPSKHVELFTSNAFLQLPFVLLISTMCDIILPTVIIFLGISLNISLILNVAVSHFQRSRIYLLNMGI